MKISFIGTGNVATHLAKAFYNKGINIHQIYSLHYKNAIELSLQVNAIPIKHLNEIE